MSNKYTVKKTEKEWLEQLGQERYNILRKGSTERPFSGVYNNHFKKGIYRCEGCNTELFKSNHKFENNCGWPSFDTSIEGTIQYRRDTSFGMIRTEILCATCEGHLGHVFNDGPTNTKQRYCVNSLSIHFHEEE